LITDFQQSNGNRLGTEAIRNRVAFQGERGAFSEEAAIALLGEEIDLVPRSTFADLFNSINDGVADYIVAPVENSIIGAIHPVVELLNRNEVRRVREHVLKIEQHVIGCKGGSLAGVQVIESHPAALAQCQKFFQQHPHIARIASLDTAGSVAKIVAQKDRQRAAIAGSRAAEFYGGEVLQENVQDNRENYTRFILLRALNSGLDS
jgi:prephenate dehydratase